MHSSLPPEASTPRFHNTQGNWVGLDVWRAVVNGETKEFKEEGRG